jgi:hypothetical protein
VDRHRLLAIALTVFTVAVAILAIFSVQREAMGGILRIDPSSVATDGSFDVPTYQSPSLDGALLTGDKIELGQMDRNSRIVTVLSAGSGDRAILKVAGDNGAVLAVPIVVTHHYAWGLLWSKLSEATAFALFGLFLIWTSRGRTSTFLALFCLLDLPGTLNWYSWFPIANRPTYFLIATLCTSLANLCLYAFAESFFYQRIGDRTRTVGRVLAAMGVIAPVAYNSEVLAYISNGSAGITALTTAWGLRLVPATSLAVLVVAAVGYIRSPGRERVRNISVLVATIGLVIATSWGSYLAATGVGLSIDSDDKANLLFPLLAVITILCVIVYVIAVLLQRLLDVSFIVNEVIAYVISIGVFGIVITAVEEFVINYFESRSVGIVFLFVMIAILSITFSTFHHAIEQNVERILFRRKHEAIKKLRRFADDVRFISSERELLQRTCATIRDALNAQHVAIYARAADGFALVETCEAGQLPPCVDTDDPVFVRLAAHAVDALLHEFHSSLGSEGLAVALAVPDTFIGAIVCGARSNHMPYSPDDRDALEILAGAVANSLQLLRLKAAAAAPKEATA